jgi:hypothetical protein
MTEPRTPQLVINQAIRENRPAEYTCYTLIGVFTLVGVGVIIWGAVTGAGLVALAGAVASGLFWPALSNAVNIRKENIAIRLLEIPLSRSETGLEAAVALREILLEVIAKRRPE